MKIRKGTELKAEMQMTPMIDIVFQLLTFFLFTFRIGGAEGDFNIKMPLGAASGLPDDINKLPPMKIRLQADPTTGRLARITLNDKSFGTDFDSLRNYIIGVVGDAQGPGSIRESAEVELDCDYNLRYEYVIYAVTAVSGYVSPDGQIVRLIEKLRFSPPRPRLSPDLQFDLRSNFDHAVRGQVEEFRRRLSVAGHPHEQVLTPPGHARFRRGPQGFAPRK